MNNQSFSKISIVIILIVLIAAGFLCWQYLKKTEVKPPKEEEKEISTEAIDKFMDLRIKGESELYSYFPGYANVIDLTLGKVLTSFSRILLTAPDLKKHEVVKAKEIGPGKSQFTIKTYLGKEKNLGYYEEKIIIEKIRGKSFVTSFKQSDYISLVQADPCKDVDQERTHIGVVPLANKDLCYWKLAMEEKNPNTCNNIGTQLAKDFCYQELATILDDLNLCNRIKTESGPGITQQGCQEKVNFWRTREELNKQYKPYQPEPIGQWKVYRNEEYGFELKYPEGSKLEEKTTESWEGKRVLRLDLPFTSKTKLKEKYLTIMVGEGKPETCCRGCLVGVSEKVSINGTDFSKEIAGDCAMQACYGYENYYSTKDNKCFSLDFVLHYTTINSPEFSDAWKLMDFDKNQESVICNQVLSTFNFID